MIKGLFRKLSKVDEPAESIKGAINTDPLTFQTGEALLTPHLKKIESIYQTLSISREHFKKLYIPLMENLALLVQKIPASENHHHAYLGGLLEHSLEVGVYASRLRQGVMIRGVAEDQMAIVSEALSYAIITAGLMHDIGKSVTDVQIANTTRSKVHLPLLDTPRIGDQYTFRFKAERAYTDHQKANLQLVTKLMPENGIRWLSQYPDILQNWARALAGEYSDAGDIGRIVARADSTSTERATISHAATGQSASQNPLSKMTPADTFVRILRSMMEAEPVKLPLNKKGAAAWVTPDYIYYVSKRIIDEVRKGAERLGPSVSLPDDNSSLMTMLGDGKKIKLNDGKAIHTVTVKEGNWEVKMTFLVFDRNQIDPAGKLPETQSTLIDTNTGELLYQPSKPAGSHEQAQQTQPEENQLTEVPEKTNPTPSPAVDVNEPQPAPPIGTVEQDDNITMGEHTGSDNTFFSSYTAPASPSNTNPSEVSDLPPGLDGIAPLSPSAQRAAKTVAKSSPRPPVSEFTRSGSEQISGKNQMGLHFTAWLKQYVTLNMSKINGPGSTLHIAEPGCLVMVTPAVFAQYLDDNRAVYKDMLAQDVEDKVAGRYTRRELIRKIQNSAETKLTYRASFDGQKIIKIKLAGNRHSGTVNGYVLDQSSTSSVFGAVPVPSHNERLTFQTPLT